MKNFFIFLLTLGAYCQVEAQTTPPPPSLFTSGSTQPLAPPAPPAASSIGVPIGNPPSIQYFYSPNPNTSLIYSIASQNFSNTGNTFKWNYVGNILISATSTSPPYAEPYTVTTWNYANGKLNTLTQKISSTTATTTNTLTYDAKQNIDSITQTINPFLSNGPITIATWNYANNAPFSYTGVTSKTAYFQATKTEAPLTTSAPSGANVTNPSSVKSEVPLTHKGDIDPIPTQHHVFQLH